jgi:hypothetical protein
MPTPKISVNVPLVPAAKFELMTGRNPCVRLHGWTELLDAGYFGCPTLSMIWEAHAPTLLAEAEAHGFQPAGLVGRRPTGPNVEAWVTSFLAMHSY